MEEGFKPCPFCAEPIREAATVCRYCNRPLRSGASFSVPAGSSPVGGASALPRVWKVFFYAVVISGIAFLVVWGLLQNPDRLHSAKSNPTSSSDSHSASLFSGRVLLKPTPIKQKLLSGNLEVEAGQIRWMPFTVPSGATDVRISGEFHAFGGSGNDIQAIVTDSFDFENWKNGHATKVIYNSGKVTNGAISTQTIAPGQYVLAFDNRFSMFSRKQITGEITLSYLVH